MMKKNKINILIIAIILMFLFMLFLFPTKVQAQYEEIRLAQGIIDPNDFEPNDLTQDDTKIVTGKAAKITGTIGVIGAIVSVIALIIIGIKFMLGSVEEKAEYKKSMIPYLIGVLIFFTLTQLLNIIVKFVEGFNA